LTLATTSLIFSASTARTSVLGLLPVPDGIGQFFVLMDGQKRLGIHPDLGFTAFDVLIRPVSDQRHDGGDDSDHEGYPAPGIRGLTFSRRCCDAFENGAIAVS
jgi:hypothetical protein